MALTCSWVLESAACQQCALVGQGPYAYLQPGICCGEPALLFAERANRQQLQHHPSVFGKSGTAGWAGER